MKIPRYSLPPLVALIAAMGILMAWVHHQLNWIRERHQFLDENVCTRLITEPHAEAPWSLRLFGGCGEDGIACFKEDMARAAALFPESDICDAEPPK